MEIAMSVLPRRRSVLPRSAACGEPRSMPTPFGSRISAFWAGCVVAVLAAVLAPSAHAQSFATQLGAALGHPVLSLEDAQFIQGLNDAHYANQIFKFQIT